MGQGSAEAVIEEAEHSATSAEEGTTGLFYAHYYLAKYHEIVDQKELAYTHIRESLKYEIPHFMYACAEVDAKRMESWSAH